MISLNLPNNDVTDFTQLIFCFGLFASLALCTMPIWEIYEKTRLYKQLPTTKIFPPAKRVILRTLVVVLSAYASMGIPKFGLFVNFIGAFSCTALMFVFPIRIYDKLFAEEIRWYWKIFHQIFMIFGLVIGAISAYISVNDLIEAIMVKPKDPEIIDISDNEVFRLDLNPPLPLPMVKIPPHHT